MPSGTEIHLGFIGPDAIFTALREMKTPLKNLDGQIISLDELRNTPLTAYSFEIDPDDTTGIHANIEAAYYAVAARLKWQMIRMDRFNHPIFSTPHGIRTTTPFSLVFQFDDEELGDEPEDASLGINLSSRYYPSVLDIKSPHGTLGNAISLDAFQNEIIICREEIVKRVPAFDLSQIFIREIFY